MTIKESLREKVNVGTQEMVDYVNNLEGVSEEFKREQISYVKGSMEKFESGLNQILQNASGNIDFVTENLNSFEGKISSYLESANKNIHFLKKRIGNFISDFYNFSRN